MIRGSFFHLTHEHMPDKTGSTGDSRYSCGINIYNRLREDHSVSSDIVAYVPLSLTKTVVRFRSSRRSPRPTK